MRIVRLGLNFIAASFAWPFGSVIFTGNHFYKLSHNFQRAVLLHEEGHIRLGHHRKRIKSAFLFFLRLRTFADVRKETHKEEFEADLYAASLGYGHHMIGLARLGLSGGAWHPSANERIANLEEYMK